MSGASTPSAADLAIIAEVRLIASNLAGFASRQRQEAYEYTEEAGIFAEGLALMEQRGVANPASVLRMLVNKRRVPIGFEKQPTHAEKMAALREMFGLPASFLIASGDNLEGVP